MEIVCLSAVQWILANKVVSAKLALVIQILAKRSRAQATPNAIQTTVNAKVISLVPTKPTKNAQEASFASKVSVSLQTVIKMAALMENSATKENVSIILAQM